MPPQEHQKIHYLSIDFTSAFVVDLDIRLFLKNDFLYLRFISLRTMKLVPFFLHVNLESKEKLEKEK